MLPSASSVEYPPDLSGPQGKRSSKGRIRTQAGQGGERRLAGDSLAADRAERQDVLVLTGWAGEAAILSDGRRQIFSLALPGDHIELSARPSSSRRFIALTPLELVRRPLRDEPVARTAGRRRDALDREFRHMLRLGRLTPTERVLNLFLELYDRLKPVGLAKDDSFRLPLSQDVVADLLGLSSPRLAKALREIERERLASFRFGAVTLLQTGRLPALACYGPAAMAA